MVFESLVTEVLNRFLGSYIENLDTKQLNIGIWGGDVVLKNLAIKGTALSDLNLPIKLYQGHLGKLTLKIPWKNLYSAPVIASIEGLYVLLVPNSAVRYDEEAEEKARQEIKQKELEKIEEAKKKQELAKENATGTAPKQDSFVEKLVSQVIKNLQVKVSEIHIRYEDTFSNPTKPFAFGATLSCLSFDTTDENWKQCVVTDAVRMIYKIVRLEALSLYWNSGMTADTSFISLKRDELVQTFSSGIARTQPGPPNVCSVVGSQEQQQQSDELVPEPEPNTDPQHSLPPGYSYLLKPLTSLAQLRLNPKPEMDGTNFTTPKVLLNLIIEGICLGLRQCQYQDILELLESLENLNLKSRYRKYRPILDIYGGHCNEWWHFAINCVLGEIVKPRLGQWSWTHISHHRALVKKYIAAYKIKLTFKKLPAETKVLIDDAEKQLDVFNITLARQQASLEIKREGLLKAQEAVGWFSGWLGGWGAKGKTDASNGQEGIAAKFNEAMTPEERKKLYQAIDYTETGIPPEYPKEFVQNVFHFKLFKLSLSLYTTQQWSEKTLTQMMLNGLGVTFEQCPGADAQQLEVNMDNFTVFGMDNGIEGEPLIIRTIKTTSDDPLVHLLYEANPLDKLCDQRIHFIANPLEIIYDAGTINKLGDFFKPPESVKLKHLHNAAVSTIEDVKQTTATGYKYAMGKRKIMDLKVQIKSSHILIPDKGIYKPHVDLLLLDLGNFSMNSLNGKVTSPMGTTPDDKEADIENLMEQSYDKIELKIDNIQLLYAKKDDEWRKYKEMKTSALHLLKPGGIKIRLEKSIITDDPKMPKLRIFGVLPDLTFDISNKKLEDIISLLMSIPRPAPQDATTVPDQGSEALGGESSTDPIALDSVATDSKTSMSENFRLAESEAIDSRSSIASSDSVQLTSLFLKFEIKMISLNLYQESQNEHKPLLSFCIKSIGAIVESRTFDTIIISHLKSVTLQNFQYAGKSGPLYLINSADNMKDQNFVSCNIIIANVNGPDFVTEYERIEKNISVKFCPLKLRLHQESLTSLLTMVDNLTKKIEAESEPKTVGSHTETATISGDVKAKSISIPITTCSLKQNSINTGGSVTNSMRKTSQNALLSHHASSGQAGSSSRNLDTPTVTTMMHNTAFVTPPSSIASSHVMLRSKSSPTETLYFSPGEDLPTHGTNTKREALVKPLALTPRKRKDGVEIIDMSLDVDIESVSLGVLNTSLYLANITLNGLATQIFMQRDKTVIHTTLRTLSIEDKMPGIFYKNILSTIDTNINNNPNNNNQGTVRGGEILRAKVTMYNNGPSSKIWKDSSTNSVLYDVSKFDTSVDLNLGGICVVVLMPFITRLQLILDSFTNTKEKIAEASAAAAEAAAEVASNLHKTAARLALHIEMKAPLFIVPRDSTHPDAIILDLGTLKLANHFALATPLSTPQHLPDKTFQHSLEQEKAIDVSPPSSSSHSTTTILDKLLIELNDFKISRILVDEKTKMVKAEVMILEPANISLEVRRNLMFGLNSTIPEIDISGQLSNKTLATGRSRQSFDIKGIEMSMSEEDLTAIMNILNDNLSAPPPVEPVANSASTTGGQGKRSSITPSIKDNSDGALTTPNKVTTKASPKLPHKTNDPVPGSNLIVPPGTPVPTGSTSKADAINGQVPTKISFKFQFDKLAAALYYGSSNLTSGTVPRDPKKALSRIEIIVISIVGTMKTDNALDTKISLYNLILDDKRPALQSGITRMIEMRKDTDNQTKSEKLNQLIHLTYQQDAASNKNIGATVNRLYVCLCIDFLMSMGDFFTKNMPKPSTTAQNASKTPATTQAAKKLPNSPCKNAETTSPTTSTLLRFLLNEPEVVLIENPLDPNTKSLILTMQMGFLYDQTSARTLMDGKLSQMQIIACPLPLESREGNTAQILNPLNISLSCDSPSPKDQSIMVDVTDIVLNISPATIRVLSAVANTKGPEKPADTQTELLSLPPNLWDVKELSTCDYWFLHTEIGHDALDSLHLEVKALSDTALESEGLQKAKDDFTVSTPTPRSSISKPSIAEELNVNFQSIMVTIEAGVENRTVPMIKLQSRVRAQVKNWSGLMAIRGKVTAEAGYYNEYLALWEPLIEPIVSHDQTDHKIKRPWELIFELNKNPEIDEDELTSDLEENKQQRKLPHQAHIPSDKLDSDIHKAEVLALLPNTSITVVSKDVLNVTFTKSCLQMLNNLSAAFGDAVNQKEPTMKPDDLNAPYVVNNLLGCEVILGPDKNLKFIKESQKSSGYSLEAGEKVQMFLTSEDTDLKPGIASLHQIQPHRKRGSLLDNERTEEYYLDLKFPTYETVSRRIAVNQVRKIYIELPVKDAVEGRKFTGIVVEITSVYGCKRLTLESPLKLINYFAVPMEIYVAKPGIKQGLTSIACLETNQTWNVPLDAILKYTQFFFKPYKEPYKISKDGVEWKTHTSSAKLVLSCSAVDPQYEPFYLSVCEMIEYIYGESENQPIKNLKYAYSKTLHLMPTVCIINLLPYTITHKLSSASVEVSIAPGDTAPLYNACVGKSTIEINIKDYVNKVWSSTLKLTPAFEEFEVMSFYAPSRQLGGKRHALDMGLHIVRDKGMLEISIFSPYWMINQTGLTLSYQRAESIYSPSPIKSRDNTEESSSVVEHKAGIKLPFLFSFRPKAFFSKKKASIKVENSEWSDKFSLDTVGSSGVVSCRNGDTSYEIGVEIVLSKTGFTKVVTFIPYYTIVNKSKLDIQMKEYYTDRPQANVGDWQSIPAKECIPFWPRQSPNNKNMALIAKFKGSNICTTPFPINRPHSTLMALDNRFGGINVECHVSDVAVTITFDQYYHGQDVILLINHTGDDSLYYHQSGIKDIMSLPPNKSVLFAWKDALQQEKYLVWSCGDKKNIKFDMVKDGFGEFNSSVNHHKIYWVSFLDGTQRVLMFTEDLALVCIAQQAGELEKVEQEMDISLEGISVSIVDNWQLMVELIYASIGSTGLPVWELCTTSFPLAGNLDTIGKKSKTASLKYKPLKLAECEVFERAYQEYLTTNASQTLAPTATLKMIESTVNNGSQTSATPAKPLALKPGMSFDFGRMALLKHGGTILEKAAGSGRFASKHQHSPTSAITYQPLKRTFRPGLWIQYRTSPHQVQLHAKLNKLQVDDQIPSCTFPVVVGVVPLPKSVSSETVPRPLFEVSLLKRNIEHSSVQQIKYFKVLVQETFLRADQGFINTMISFFAFPNNDQINLRKEDFNSDIEMAEVDHVRASADRVITTGQKNFYDFLHFSPIKVHLSFSLQATGSHHKDPRISTEEYPNSDPSTRGSTPGASSSLSLRRKEQLQIQQHQQMMGPGGSSPSPSPQNTSPESHAPVSPIKSAALNFLLQSVGVTLTDIDDVVFKLAYFERTYRFYTQSQLMHEVTKHYVTQALKQMYVLVLGLDVLGNPFGLIRGLTEGMGDLFYEPYQGAIQGPEEFAQGLALGVRSLFGHTIGGAAGAVSRITGTLGKGLAALTMDQDYQKSRREELNKRPADLKEGVARGGKGLVMGFYEGVTGIVTKPMEGAKQEGATGFFKGVGKGLVGVVARPTSGVVDFASSSFQGIKRLAENVDEVHRQRPRRYIQKDGVIRPYDFNEAEGYEIFRAVEKGHSDQTYLYHTFLSPDMKTVLILTNESIFQISKGELFGQWVIDWSHNWDQIIKSPVYMEKTNGIRLDFRGETKKKKCMQSLLSRDDANYHTITLKNKEKAEIIMAKINEILESRNRGT